MRIAINPGNLWSLAIVPNPRVHTPQVGIDGLHLARLGQVRHGRNSRPYISPCHPVDGLGSVLEEGPLGRNTLGQNYESKVSNSQYRESIFTCN